MISEEIIQMKRSQAEQEKLLKYMQGYFDTKRDEDGMMNFVKLMNLGCFGKEFHAYGVAYEDEEGTAYRVSGKVSNLYEFVKYSGVDNYYPTQVLCNVQRKTSPGGYEKEIQKMMKKETALRLRETYNAQYFQSMRLLGMIPANNEAMVLLSEMQEYLDGRYIESELELFEGILLTAVNRKVLNTMQYHLFADWLADVRQQMQSDIIEKGNYEKTMSAFSYRDCNGRIGFFTDAYLSATYEAQERYELNGFTVTPVYVKKYWMRNTNEFFFVKKQFEQHIRECFDDNYWRHYHTLLQLSTPVSPELYLEQKTIVQNNCSDSAYRSFLRYGRRWGAEE
jgi:hypothetical protein